MGPRDYQSGTAGLLSAQAEALSVRVSAAYGRLVLFEWVRCEPHVRLPIL